MTQTIKTTCPYCGVGCGIEATVDQSSRRISVRGDQSHPANFGRLCSKGSALDDTVTLAGRLLRPRIGDHECDWDQALDEVANGFKRIIDEHGPGAVAIYGSGQLLTEDYYVANKLMKGFIGAANIDTNSRLCMSSTVAGHKRAFGSDTVPGCYQDLELADLIVLVGSNTAWCHPVLFQRIRAAKAERPSIKVVVIDPRQTSSCDLAELHLSLMAGSDGWLFNGLLRHLHEQGQLDQRFIDQHTQGLSVTLTAAAEADPARVAKECGLAIDDVLQFYQWFAGHQRVVTVFSQGINQSSSGTDKVNAIVNCHLATGRIGKPGMGPFSVTGQPNAMGGREVGGLAHQLAAHMDFSNPDDIDRVSRFWQAKAMALEPGYPAVALFDAVYDGRVKAIWIMGTNPVVSLPDADKVKAALERCPLVIVSDCMADTDTTKLADILLPACGWSEKDGTVTNSERCISRQRALFKAAGEAKPDWWMVCQLAKRLGYGDAFDYQNPYQIFREHAALSGFENDAVHGLRDFDISALVDLDEPHYRQLQPLQWPVNAQFPQGRQRLFDDGQFFTDSGRAQFIPVTPRPPVNSPDSQYPLILNSGRVRDQWHTMTRTGLSARLSQHKAEPFVEIHPQDANDFGVLDRRLAVIESAFGKMVVRIAVTTAVNKGNLFVPMHWSDQTAADGRVGALVNAVVDPISKQPESKQTPVRLFPYLANWYGFLLTRAPLPLDCGYWAKITGERHVRFELAGVEAVESRHAWGRRLLGYESNGGDWLEFHDSGNGGYRLASLLNGQLQSVLFIAPDHDLPERGWLSGLFAKQQLDVAERSSLLSGKPPSADDAVGTIVCSCFNIGENTIRKAIGLHGCKTVQDIGKHLKAGSNCGSCIPELKKML